MRTKQPLRAVLTNCSEKHKTSKLTTFKTSIPCRGDRPERSFVVHGRSEDGRNVIGIVGPALIPNVQGMAPWRPLDMLGVVLEPDEDVVFDLKILFELTAGARIDQEVDLVDALVGETSAEELLHGMNVGGPVPGFYFGKELWQPTQWFSDVDLPSRKVVRAVGEALGIKVEDGQARPIAQLTLEFGADGVLFDFDFEVIPTFDASEQGRTPMQLEIPMLSLVVDDTMLLHVDFCIERGGGEPLYSAEHGGMAIVLQMPTETGAGHPMVFKGALGLASQITTNDSYAQVWRNRIRGGVQACAHYETVEVSLPPYGFTGGKLRTSDDAAAVRTAYKKGFRDLLRSKREQVANGHTRSVWSDPGVKTEYSTICNRRPADKGKQAAFGFNPAAAQLWGDRRGNPFALYVLDYFMLTERQRPNAWYHQDGRLLQLEDTDDVFYNGMPHYNKWSSPSQLGMIQDAPRFHPGGWLGHDQQHATNQADAVWHLHRMSPVSRQLIDRKATVMMLERSPRFEAITNSVDSTRAWRGMRVLLLAYALTGDERIPVRLAEFLPVYDRPSFWDKRLIDEKRLDPELHVPFIEAARRDLEIIAPRVYAPYPATLNRPFDAVWEIMLSSGGPDMAICIRESEKATQIAGALLEDFEMALGKLYDYWMRVGFGKDGTRAARKAIAWPKQQADGLLENTFDPANRYTGNGDPTKTYDETSVYSDWVVFVLQSMVTPGVLGKVTPKPESIAKAATLLKQSVDGWLEMPERWRTGFLENQMRWQIRDVEEGV